MIAKATAVCLCAGIVFSSYGFKLELKPIGAKAAPKETVQPAEDLEYWDNIEEVVASPEKPVLQLKHVETWFENSFSKDGFGYVYGGKTAYKIQKGTSKHYSGILACYLDNNEYSGVTVCRAAGKVSNLEPLRKARAAGIGFWAKAGTGLSSVYLGLLDDDSDNKKVQTKLLLGDFGKIDTTWRYFLIPLKRFSSKGKYWDENKKTEIISDVNWKAMAEVRFSTNSRGNTAAPDHPLRLFIEDISFIEDMPGYVDPSDYWASFQSNAPDLLLHDFETPADQNWAAVPGPGSEATVGFPDPSRRQNGKHALSISYKMYQWCDIIYDYKQQAISREKRSWTSYWGLKIDVFSAQGYQPFNIQVSDAGDELFIVSCGAPYGWSQIIVPFKDFAKFPYYQPPEAVQNGKFDMNGVTKIDIKPAGEGNSGSFMVDNITLTNDRVPQKAVVAERKKITVSGSFDSVVVSKINPGIFGINAQTWDGDLLEPKTAAMVKAVRHTFVRFPGGLTSDEYHWKDVLAKKDHLVDVDEFLDFCKRTNTEPSFTVNFGSGTPEEAAEWVRYVNGDKKSGVRYWEIGNELYGSWHKYPCGAKEYGMKCVEFIKAMKAVDPSILTGVVWQLSGDWNRTVFEYTKDVADAVIVHNYTQEIGDENDINLLSSPQRLDTIFSRIRKQARETGAPGKTYQVWLTEWNSVNNDPSPQTLGMVNGLFVADYLGMLAKNNIDLAAYWNIHNGIFDRGGDYGYLTRSDVPEGPNVPRPSYRAFKVARESLQGKLVLCRTDDINVSVYATIQPDGSKSMLIINKYPVTAGDIAIDIPGFEGTGSLTQITNDPVKKESAAAEVTVKKGDEIKIPAYSISVLKMK